MVNVWQVVGRRLCGG